MQPCSILSASNDIFKCLEWSSGFHPSQQSQTPHASLSSIIFDLCSYDATQPPVNEFHEIQVLSTVISSSIGKFLDSGYLWQYLIHPKQQEESKCKGKPMAKPPTSIHPLTCKRSKMSSTSYIHEILRLHHPSTETCVSMLPLCMTKKSFYPLNSSLKCLDLLHDTKHLACLSLDEIR